MIAVALAVSSLCAGCSDLASATPTPLSTVGLVIAVTGPDAATVDTFTLRTNQGQIIDFTVGTLDLTNGGLPAPHLRTHQVTGTPTLVYYIVQDGNDVAIKYYDADALPSDATP